MATDYWSASFDAKSGRLLFAKKSVLSRTACRTVIKDRPIILPNLRRIIQSFEQSVAESSDNSSNRSSNRPIIRSIVRRIVDVSPSGDMIRRTNNFMPSFVGPKGSLIVLR